MIGQKIAFKVPVDGYAEERHYGTVVDAWVKEEYVKNVLGKRQIRMYLVQEEVEGVLRYRQIELDKFIKICHP